MKDILDRSFRYRPSFDTNIRRTFERVRREQKEKATQSKVVGQIRPAKKTATA